MSRKDCLILYWCAIVNLGALVVVFSAFVFIGGWVVNDALSSKPMIYFGIGLLLVWRGGVKLKHIDKNWELR